jgi:hypothetical protein
VVSSAVIAIRVDTGIEFVGDVWVMGSGVGARAGTMSGSSSGQRLGVAGAGAGAMEVWSWAMSGSETRGCSCAGEKGAVIAVWVNAGVELVGGVGIVGADVWASSSVADAVGCSMTCANTSAVGLVASAVVTVRVDTRVKLVGNVGVVRTGVGAGGVGCSVGGAADAVAAERLVASAVVTVRVDARIDLVGDVGVMRASVGAGAGAGAGYSLMASTVITVRVDTGIGLVGDVGAVGTSVGAAATLGGSGSASQRVVGVVGASMSASVGCPGAGDTRLGAVGDRGRDSMTGSGIRVDTRVQLVQEIGLVRASRGAGSSSSSRAGSSGSSGSGTSTGTVVPGSTEMLVVDTSMSSTVVTITVHTGVKLVDQVGWVRSMVRGLSRLRRLSLFACDGFFSLAYEIHDG